MSIVLIANQLLVLLGSIFVVSAVNPIFSIMFFIVVVLNLAFCLVMLSAEFLAFSFLVVYIGAICILFLFIVLMLNLRFVDVGGSLLSYILVCGLVVFLFFGGLFGFISNSSFLQTEITDVYNVSWTAVMDSFSNMVVLGSVLYDQYMSIFLLGGYVLLLGMVASIALTLEYRVLAHSPEVVQQIIRVSRLRMFS